MNKKLSFFKKLAVVLSVFLSVYPFANFNYRIVKADSQFNFTSQADFEAGNVNDNLDSSSNPGNLKLKSNLNSYTESSYSDWKNGEKSNTVIDSDEGKIKLEEKITASAYNTSSTPALISNNINYSYLDPGTGLLYICTSIGLEVRDTHGTTDISDDTEVATYNNSSPIALSNPIKYVLVDSTNHLLYIANGDGLAVVNTNGTATPNDDVLVGRYNTSSTPAGTPNIPSNSVYSVTWDADNGLLYISTASGLVVIRTQNTPNNTADDTLVGVYNTSSSPSGTPHLQSDYVSYSFTSGNRLYVGTYGSFWYAGLYVINNNGTPFNLADDTIENTFQWDPLAKNDSPDKSFLAGLYENLSNSLINTAQADYSSSSVNYAFLYNNGSNTYLYICTNGNGLRVIDTHGTANTSDDTEVGQYFGSGNGGNSPAILSDIVLRAYVDPDTGLLYIMTDRGVSIVNTNRTADTSDDTIKKDVADINGDANVSDSFFDSAHNSIYMSTTNNGLNIVKLNDGYESAGTYTSKQISLDNAYRTVSWGETKNSNQNVSVKTRTANSSSVEQLWIDEFNDGITSNVTDYYANGYPFNNISESNGILTMTDPASQDWTFNYIGSGFGDDYFPAGSTVTMRIRYVGSSATNVLAYLSTDNYESMTPGSASLNNGEWTEVSVNASQPFSVVEIDNDWDGTWNSTTDKIEIDWVKVEHTPSLVWSSWSTACSNHSSCNIDNVDGKDNVQYRLDLSTSDSTSTPSINSVILTGGYQPAGEYVSPITNAGGNAHWESLTPEQSVPDGTSLSYYTRTGNTATPDGTWSAWQAVNSPIASPDGQYLQYKAVFTTTDKKKTPTLSSVTITYNPLGLSSNNNNYDHPIVAIGNKTVYSLSDNAFVSLRGLDFFFRGRMRSLVGGRVQLFIDGNLNRAVKINKKGTWRIRVLPKKDVANVYQFKYFDSRGQEYETTPGYQLIVDRQKPVISIPQTIYASVGQTISWQVTDNDATAICKCAFRGKGYPVSDNQFVIPGTTPKGTSVLKVTCFDNAKNMESKKSNVVIR